MERSACQNGNPTFPFSLQTSVGSFKDPAGQEQLDVSTHLSKEFVGVVDRLGVVLLVLGGVDVRSGTAVLAQETGRDVVRLDLGNFSFSHVGVLEGD